MIKNELVIDVRDVRLLACSTYFNIAKIQKILFSRNEIWGCAPHAHYTKNCEIVMKHTSNIKGAIKVFTLIQLM